MNTSPIMRIGVKYLCDSESNLPTGFPCVDYYLLVSESRESDVLGSKIYNTVDGDWESFEGLTYNERNLHSPRSQRTSNFTHQLVHRYGRGRR